MDFSERQAQIDAENRTGEQSQNRTEHLKPWQFKPGQSGNPSGRPKGSISLKEYAKKMLYEMTEEERMEYLQGLDKKVIWEMAEGKPEVKQDVTSNGQTILVVPGPVAQAFNVNPNPNTETN